MVVYPTTTTPYVPNICWQLLSEGSLKIFTSYISSISSIVTALYEQMMGQEDIQNYQKSAKLCIFVILINFNSEKHPLIVLQF